MCSAVHPLGRASPVFADWPLAEHGLEWIEPPVALAHPLDDGSAALVRRDLEVTAAGLGEDGERYRRLIGPIAADWDLIARELLGPFRIGPGLRHPFAVGRYAFNALQPVTWLARRFRTTAARRCWQAAAHSFVRLERPITGAFALSLLASAHAVGWPIPRGGSQRIADALASYLRALGGEIVTDHRCAAWTGCRRIVRCCWTSPRQVLAVAGDRLGGLYATQLRRYRYGPGVQGRPGPGWTDPWANPALLEAGTVHLGARCRR